MNTTITKSKTQTRSKTEKRLAIERVVKLSQDGNPAIDYVIAGRLNQQVPLETHHGCDYYIVNNNDFAPLVAKDSLLRVYTNISGDCNDGYPQCPRLVARNSRLEICTYEASKGAQVVGMVEEIRRWTVGNPIIPSYNRES